MCQLLLCKCIYFTKPKITHLPIHKLHIYMCVCRWLAAWLIGWLPAWLDGCSSAWLIFADKLFGFLALFINSIRNRITIPNKSMLTIRYMVHCNANNNNSSNNNASSKDNQPAARPAITLSDGDIFGKHLANDYMKTTKMI